MREKERKREKKRKRNKKKTSKVGEEEIKRIFPNFKQNRTN